MVGSQSIVNSVAFQASSIGFEIDLLSIPDKQAQHHVFKRGVALKMIGAGFLAEDGESDTKYHASTGVSPIYFEVDVGNETYSINLKKNR